MVRLELHSFSDSSMVVAVNWAEYHSFLRLTWFHVFQVHTATTKTLTPQGEKGDSLAFLGNRWINDVPGNIIENTSPHGCESNSVVM